MFLLKKPSEARIRELVATQRELDFSYPEVGASRHAPPSGYTVDHHRIQLGKGSAAFARACGAVRRWEMFHLGWVQLCWPDTPIRAGSAVAVLAHPFGLW